MIIDFSRQGETQISFAHRYAPGEIDLEDETAQVVDTVEVGGTARQTAEFAEVAGKICASLEIACSRCLQSVAVDFENQFEVEFVTLESYEKSSAEHEHELHGADFEVSVYDGQKIDLDEIVREQILLNLPAHQLCAETCKGLCEKCGANKNNAACDCENEEIDPRWSALKNLKIEK